jgi:hypothetical protein
MDVNVQLHAPAALPPGKAPLVPWGEKMRESHKGRTCNTQGEGEVRKVFVTLVRKHEG